MIEQSQPSTTSTVTSSVTGLATSTSQPTSQLSMMLDEAVKVAQKSGGKVKINGDGTVSIEF